MNNDKDFMAVRDDMIDNYLGKTFTKGGFLHGLFSWLAKNTGIGSYFVNNSISSIMSGMGQTPNGQATQQNQVAAGSGQTSANPDAGVVQTNAGQAVGQNPTASGSGQQPEQS
jgi:hypothetical protein